MHQICSVHLTSFAFGPLNCFLKRQKNVTRLMREGRQFHPRNGAANVTSEVVMTEWKAKKRRRTSGSGDSGEKTAHCVLQISDNLDHGIWVNMVAEEK